MGYRTTHIPAQALHACDLDVLPPCFFPLLVSILPIGPPSHSSFTPSHIIERGL